MTRESRDNLVLCHKCNSNNFNLPNFEDIAVFCVGLSQSVSVNKYSEHIIVYNHMMVRKLTNYP